MTLPMLKGCNVAAELRHWFFQKLDPEQREGFLAACGLGKGHSLGTQYQAVDHIAARLASRDPEAAKLEEMREALRPFAEQRTVDELLHGPDPWADLTVEQRIERMGQRKQESTENILNARAVLAKCQTDAALTGAKREWQPIETAPRGPRILVFEPNGLGPCVASAGWLNDSPDKIEWQVVNDITVEPTLWMPLPRITGAAK